jgi:hypothetical protein
MNKVFLARVVMVVCSAAGSSLPGLQAQTAPPKKVDFIHEVRPLLKQSCYQCHGPEKKKGSLRLDVKALALKGGNDGPVIIPGQGDKSPLIQRLLSKDEDQRMPQNAEPLSAVQIDLIRAWIDQGAPWPETSAGDGADSSKHWAFQPLAHIPPPKVKNTSWVRTPVDNFILAELEKRQVHPNPTADRRTLIRRAYLDLLGFPPTPQEVEAFVNDPSLDAYPKLIDQLLASPHYGERWARHWLDAARFGESHGFEQDYDRPYAFWYRDFVIKALNEDMPFNQFIRWQLAGDELEPDNPWAMAATGFIGAGVFPTQLTEAEFEPARYDELDNMAATTGTAMLGLTIGCARCHDHKFDPISSREYYRFITTFALTIRSEIDLNFTPEKYQQAKTKFDRAHAPLVAARQKFEQEQLPQRFEKWLRSGPKQSLARPAWVILDPDQFTSKGGASLSKLADSSVMASGKNPDRDTYTFVAHTELTNITSLRIEALADPSLVKGGPGRSDNGNIQVTEVRVSAGPLHGETNAVELRLINPRASFEQNAELSVQKAIDRDPKTGWAVDPQFGTNHAAVFEIQNPPRYAGGTKLTVTLEFNGNKRHTIGRTRLAVSTLEVPVALDGASAPQKVVEIFGRLAGAGEAAALSDEERRSLMEWYRNTDRDWQKLDAAVLEHLKEQPKPDLKKVMVSSEGFKPLHHNADERGFPHFYRQTYFLKRGDTRQKGEEMTTGFLKVLEHAPGGEAHWEAPPPSGTRTSWRRRALADWIADTKYGAGDLLARVAVNRVWQHHFGEGIVATPNDFGTQGARPSNLALLDWLAADLGQHGWNLKRMHKLIVTSATYMESVAQDEERAKVDPDNKLLWRHNRERLEAESIRDSMLAVSGLLDERMFGPGTLDESMRRRSIYFFIKRSQLISVMQLFDAPDPSVSVGNRVATTIAPQALLFMNNPKVREYARALANRLQSARENSATEAIVEGYQLALGRTPNAEELERSTTFLAHQSASYRADGKADPGQLALADFCQALFGLNEFIYVE